MSACKNISPKKRKICIGDMSHRITLQVRNIKSKGFNDPDYDEEFCRVLKLWAALQTTRGYQSFNDVGIQNNITHKFYIRYSKSFTVTSEDWLELDCVKYDILDVENLDQRNEFIVLYCTRKGCKNVLANSA